MFYTGKIYKLFLHKYYEKLLIKGEINMIGIIIQARMNSTRLYGKILKEIGYKNLLEHIFFRLSYLKHKVDIVVATTNTPKDNIVLDFCVRRGVRCFRGSELNVLERYYLCAKKYKFKHIIRLTADNPFTDIEELDRLIELHIETKSDYSHSFGVLPVGVGAEIFTLEALKKSYYYGKEVHHLEHVNEYMLENPNIFKTAVLNTCEKKNRPDIRLTVDTEEDYKKACFIVDKSKKEYINTIEAIELCLQYV